MAAVSLALAGLVLAACGTGPAARYDDEPAITPELLLGRWRLAEYTFHNLEATFHPGDEWWFADYFIEFNRDGTFSELNFWTPMFGATGTWELSGDTVYLALDLGLEDLGAIYGLAPFVGPRALGISPDGNTLTMRYERPALYYYWEYTAVFSRAVQLDGYGEGREGPLVGLWALVDIVNVPLEYLVADEVEFLADGTGMWFSNPEHIPPGAVLPFAVWNAEAGMYAAPFRWSAENGRATMESFGMTTVFEYEIAGATLTAIYDRLIGSHAISRRVR